MRGSRRAGAAPALAAVALAVALAALPPAAAHAELLSSTPAQGAHLDAIPARAEVAFTEPIEPAATTLQVLDAQGRRVDLGEFATTAEPPSVSVRMPAALSDGAYRLVWRTLSRTDGHESAGTVGFAVGGFAPPDPTSAGGDAAGPALARAIAYAGFALAFGAAAFRLWMPRLPGMAHAARVAMLAGATLHLAGTGLLFAHTSAATGLGLQEMAAATEGGKVLAFRIVAGAAAWALMLLWTVRPVAAGPAVVTSILLASALGSARLGHPYAHGAAAMMLDFLHLVSAAAWVGGLVMLLHLARRPAEGGEAAAELRRAGVRFGTLALVCVTVLAFSGVVVAVDVVGADALAQPDRLAGSPYALLLAGKILVAALMVAVAAVNRYVLLEEPARGGLAGILQGFARRITGGRLRPLARAAFRRTVAVEAGLGAAVLVLAGLLASVSPPAAPGPEPLAVHGQGQFYLAEVAIDPPPRANGTSEVRLRITPIDPADAPVENNTCGRAACVSLAIASAGQPDAPEVHVAHPGGGTWLLHGVVWTRAGTALATLAVSTGGEGGHFLDEIPLRFEVAP